MKSLVFKSLVSCAALFAAPLALAQDSSTPGAPGAPGAPLTWMIPYMAGGGTDATARVLAKPLGEILERPVVIDNKPGGGTSIGAAFLARAKPDGNTIGTLDAGTVSILPHIQAKLPYDAQKSFSYVGGIAMYPWVLVINPKVPANNLRELIDLAKANPGKLTFGTPNPKGGALLSMSRFQEAAGIQLTHVPYRGDTAAIQDLLAGQM